MSNDKYMRYVKTYIIRHGELKGMRTVLGRNTYATAEEAAAALEAMERNNGEAVMSMFPGLQVTAVECWRMRDGSVGDPKRVIWLEETGDCHG